MKQESAVAADKSKAGGRSAKKPKSASYLFRTSLRSLTVKIDEGQRHYVRCVKPNVQKVPHRFSAPMVAEQLLFSGVLEAIRIRHQGFSSRMPFAEFAARYTCVVELLAESGERPRAQGLDIHELLRRLVEVLGDVVGAGQV